MRKDITFAVLVGFVLGALTAIIVVNLPNFFNRPSSTQVSETIPSVAPTIPAHKDVKLTIEQPLDETIASKKSISVIGGTDAGNTVVMETNLDIDVKESSSDGSSPFPVNLAEGGNTFTITAYNEKGQSGTKTLTVFYTSEKL